jgi:hypothetical protein
MPQIIKSSPKATKKGVGAGMGVVVKELKALFDRLPML